MFTGDKNPDLCCSFLPFQVGDFLRTPFIKFVLNSVAFFVFLALIVTFSFTEKPSAGSARDTKDELGLQNFHEFYKLYQHNLSAPYKNFHRLYLREFRPGIYQLLICLWIVGKKTININFLFQHQFQLHKPCVYLLPWKFIL